MYIVFAGYSRLMYSLRDKDEELSLSPLLFSCLGYDKQKTSSCRKIKNRGKSFFNHPYTTN